MSKLDREQAAAAFMLGESQGTSAGGASEAGKFLRIRAPTRFAYRDDWQGNRFYELLQQVPLEVYLLNTGRVGGPEEMSAPRTSAPSTPRLWSGDHLRRSNGTTTRPSGLSWPARSRNRRHRTAPAVALYERQARTTEYQGLWKVSARNGAPISTATTSFTPASATRSRAELRGQI